MLLLCSQSVRPVTGKSNSEIIYKLNFVQQLLLINLSLNSLITVSVDLLSLFFIEFRLD